ncbi:AhpC/TSA family protein [Terrimonas sp. NA20]|uniref:AhpC/TSA family protein n=1 Tax=Terrimonas ginsenosidimutans TaxID=2908004 RepID=A0ABS9KQB2_9BACT|nr:TlpA disulfide reductase family protein [Terrimonas ginsenosidimutans]MCG2614460.1 AhpC/TSA family protein [Terrimonas ginsenosidimutans]
MQRLIITILAGVLLVACENKSGSKYFEVSGIIANSNAKYIYLEKAPANSRVPSVEDSVKLEPGGKFVLIAKPDEAAVFNLRLDQNMYPVASVINDTDKVKLTIQLNKENQQFADKYEVQGSPASQEMKEFMYAFGNSLQGIYGYLRQAETLRKEGAADSVLFPIMTKKRELAEQVKQLTLASLAKVSNPALAIFELGYYQTAANEGSFGLEPLSNETVSELIASAAKKFPGHSGVADVKKTLDEQAQRAQAASWIGKEAPDFELPDVNGTPVKLSSFRGKYVLVDFWASWCGPCRAENPAVVQAFNKFKGRNFTVLGVSLDRPGQKENWLQAIKDDKLNWTQVSDLQFWSSAVVGLYHFDGIPFNILVDPQGRVVAEGLRGSMLEAKLSEVL